MSARWNALYDGYAAQVLTQLASDHDTSQDAAFGAGFMRRLKDWQKTSSPEAARILVAQFLDQVYPSALPRNPDVARWLFKAYLGHRHNGRPILAEDLYKLRDDIAYFDKVKKSQAFSHNGDQADLLQYKSYDGLMQTLRRYRAARQLRDDARAAFHVTPEQREIIVKETTFLYDGPEGKIVIVHTPRSSQYWGRNTKWCISGEKYAGTYFPDYNAKGPCIFLLPKAGGSANKLALAGKALWNAEDHRTSLPPAHEGLWNAMMMRQPTAVSAQLAELMREAAAAYSPDVHEEAVDLAQAGPEQRADRDVVLASVARNGYALAFASGELQADRAVVMAAVAQDGSALKYAAPALRADREVVLAAVAREGWALEHAAPELRADREVVMTALVKHAGAFHYAASDLRGDRDFIWNAVTRAGMMLFVAPESLKYDRTFVMAAVTQHGGALEYAAPPLRADREIVMVALKRCGLMLKHAAHELKADRAFVMAAVTQNGKALEHAAAELQADREVVMTAVAQDGWALNYAAESLRADPEIVLAAVQQSHWALDCAGPALKRDPAFVAAAAMICDEIKRWAHPEAYEQALAQLPARQLRRMEELMAGGRHAEASAIARHNPACWGDAMAVLADPAARLPDWYAGLNGAQRQLYTALGGRGYDAPPRQEGLAVRPALPAKPLMARSGL